MSTKQNRPGGRSQAVPEISVPAEASVLDHNVNIICADVNEAPATIFFRTAFGILVRGKTARRHLYFNLPAAERAVRRAVDRGDRADLVLVRLVPVDARHLDDAMPAEVVAR